MQGIKHNKVLFYVNEKFAHDSKVNLRISHYT